MTETIPVPVWVAAAAALFVIWALLDRLLLPGVRWFLRRRVDRAFDELNKRLKLRVPAFHRTRRRVLIEMLTRDPAVTAAIESHSRESGRSRNALAREVERYAREIVPAFNPYLYFRVGYFLARRTVQVLYRVRMGYSDDRSLARIEPGASVVFVMNHRSNMDYVIVAYFAAQRSALSYAVGEWARVWPLQALVRSLGAYFVRRDSRNPLYRRVLARYVQAATAAGVVQAVYPEGGLSRDGRLRRPRLGLISYMVSGFDPAGERDLVFVPVGINYDRVLEDRTLVRERVSNVAVPRSRAHVVRTLFGFVRRQAALRLRGRWHRFGYACVSFGTPISMRGWSLRHGIDLRVLKPDARFEAVERLGHELLAAIGGTVPVLPVPLVATVFLREEKRPMHELEIKAKTQALIDELETAGAYVHVPRADRDYAVAAGLRMLVLRHFVEQSDGLYRARPDEVEMLRYYANSIAHHLSGPDPRPEDGDRSGRPQAAGARGSVVSPGRGGGESGRAGREETAPRAEGEERGGGRAPPRR